MGFTLPFGSKREGVGCKSFGDVLRGLRAEVSPFTFSERLVYLVRPFGVASLATGWAGGQLLRLL